MSSKLITEYVADSINEKLELSTDRIVYPDRALKFACAAASLVGGFRLMQIASDNYQFVAGCVLVILFVRFAMGAVSVAELTPESRQRLQKFFDEENSTT